MRVLMLGASDVSDASRHSIKVGARWDVFATLTGSSSLWGPHGERLRASLLVCTMGCALRRLDLIRAKKIVPDRIPVECWIVGVLASFGGNREIVEVFEIAFDCMTDNLRTAASKMECGRV